MFKFKNLTNFRVSRFIPYYAYRFLLWKLGDQKPISAVIKITNKCNLKCIQCPWWKEREDELTTKQWKKKLDIIRSKGAIMAIFEGGEPTLRNDLQELIDYAKEIGMLTTIITNGQNKFWKFNPDIFWVSVDGLNEVYENIRVGASFQTLINNLKSSLVPFMTVITISKKNIHQIQEMVHLMSHLSSFVGFNFSYPYENAEDLSLSLEQKKYAAAELLKLKKEYINIVNSEHYFRSIQSEDRKHCGCDWMTLMVSPSGIIKQCCTFSVNSKQNCSKCECAVYREFSHALNGYIEGYRFLFMVAGMTPGLFFLNKKKNKNKI